MRPVFEKMCAAQNDRAHQGDEICGREERAERVENPRHGFARENETRKKRRSASMNTIDICNACIWFSALVRDEQTETEQGENVNQRRKHHRDDAAGDRDVERQNA